MLGVSRNAVNTASRLTRSYAEAEAAAAAAAATRRSKQKCQVCPSLGAAPSSSSSSSSSFSSSFNPHVQEGTHPSRHTDSDTLHGPRLRAALSL